jgi:hypothetical protein
MPLRITKGSIHNLQSEIESFPNVSSTHSQLEMSLGEANSSPEIIARILFTFLANLSPRIPEFKVGMIVHKVIEAIRIWSFI